VISFDFSSTATWPKLNPDVVAQATDQMQCADSLGFATRSARSFPVDCNHLPGEGGLNAQDVQFTQSNRELSGIDQSQHPLERVMRRNFHRGV